jgi:uncharacterized membrane protein (UPF0136 family)
VFSFFFLSFLFFFLSFCGLYTRSLYVNCGTACVFFGLSRLVYYYFCVSCSVFVINMDKPTGSSHMSFTFALMFGAGGAVGFIRKRSVPSLVGGLACAGLYAYSGYIINSGDPEAGHKLGLGTSTLIAAGFGARTLKTKKMMPAVLAVLGIAGSFYNFQKWSEWRE